MYMETGYIRFYLMPYANLFSYVTVLKNTAVKIWWQVHISSERMIWHKNRELIIFILAEITVTSWSKKGDSVQCFLCI